MMPPEKAKAAWSLQATGVAKRVGADDAQIKAVVLAYTEARESQGVASDKMRKEMAEKAAKNRESGDDAGGPGGPGGRGGFNAESMKAMEDMNAKERDKLKKALAATLSQDQTTKALASLGTFNRQWDGMADILAGFGLDAKKQQDALNATEDFVVAQAKARAGAAGGGGDPEAMRTAMQETRQKLMDSMKKILSEDQMGKFEGSMRGGRGPGGPGGGPDRRGGGGGGGF